MIDLTGNDKGFEWSATPDLRLRTFLCDRVVTRLEQNFEVTLIVGGELARRAAGLIRNHECRVRERLRIWSSRPLRPRMNWRDADDPIDSGVGRKR